MVPDRASELLAGLERLLELHNEVFNSPRSDEDGRIMADWSIAWPDSYRSLRSALTQISLLEDNHG